VRIAVTGASGLVGSSLCPRLSTLGNDVVRVSRTEREGSVRWDLGSDDFEASALDGIDAVVHLAGEPVVGRWTAKKKARIRDSRVQVTTRLCGAMAELSNPPAVLLCASAIGYYGDTDGVTVDEIAGSPGSDFLAKVCIDWEQATRLAGDSTRVVNLRFGMILAAGGGALPPMRLQTRLFAGGPLGKGDQIWSWISIDDAVDAIVHLLDTELSGAVNLTSPEPVEQRQFAKVLAKLLNRPAVLRTPRFGLRALLGEVVDPLMFTSIDARPRRLLESGFSFSHGRIEQAMAAGLSKSR